MKKVFATALAATLVASMSIPAFAAEDANDGITVVVNGTTAEFADQAPVVKDGRTLIPLRGVLETLGISVTWNAEEQSILAEKDDTTASFAIGSTTATVNGTETTLDVAPELLGGRTMVPLRAIAEVFGADVQWDGATKTVTITDAADPETEETAVFDTVTQEQEGKAADGSTLYTASIAYPVLNDSCTAAGKDAVNAAMLELVNDALEPAVADLKEFAGEEVPADPYSVYVTFEVTTLDDTTFSGYLDVSVDTHGAHPNTVRRGFVYNLADGTQPTLNDVLGEDAEADVKAAFEQLLASDPEAFFENSETLLFDALSSVDFYLQGDNMMCFLQQYAIAPYAAGFVTVAIAAEA